MRGKELNDEQREQILGAYLAGAKEPKISSKLGIAMTTVYDTINRYKKTGTHILKNVLVDQQLYLNVENRCYNVLFMTIDSHLWERSQAN